MYVPRLMDGGRVVIVAGGPSMAGFDYESLTPPDKYLAPVVAVNAAMFDIPRAFMGYWSDPDFYLKFKDRIDAFEGLKFTSDGHGHGRPGITPLERKGMEGLETDPRYIAHGGNSGYAAINVAFHFGASEILLLGFDMKDGPEGEIHGHDHYPADFERRINYTGHARCFRTMLPVLAEHGVKVINCTPGSAIDAFPRGDFAEIYFGQAKRKRTRKRRKTRDAA